MAGSSGPYQPPHALPGREDGSNFTVNQETIPLGPEAEAPSRSGKSQTGGAAGWNHHMPFLFSSQCSAV